MLNFNSSASSCSLVRKTITNFIAYFWVLKYFLYYNIYNIFSNYTLNIIYLLATLSYTRNSQMLYQKFFIKNVKNFTHYWFVLFLFTYDNKNLKTKSSFFLFLISYIIYIFPKTKTLFGAYTFICPATSFPIFFAM